MMDLINNKISEDVILMIFSYLSFKEKFKYRRVCKYWKYLLEKNCIARQKAIGIHLTLNYLREISGKNYKLDVNNGEILRWNCYEEQHYTAPNDVIDASVLARKTNNFRTISTHCPDIIAFDIRGIHLRNSIVKRLYRFKCLQCLQINFISSELKTWFKFVEFVVPKLSHLSINNTIDLNISELVLQTYDPFVCLFNKATNLEILCIVLYNTNNISLKSLQSLGSTIKQLLIYINDNTFESNDNICADKVFANIVKSKATLSIEKLRFHCDSNRIYELVSVFRKFKHFVNLKALSISGWYDELLAIDFCNIVKDLRKLEDLSFYFNYCTVRTLFHEFTKYSANNITILRLESAEICKRELESLTKAFPNLQFLKLVNIHFLRFNEQFFIPIEKMHNLKNLHIEYRLADDETDAINSYKFNAQHSNALYNIIRNTRKLMEFSIINWPGIDRNIFNMCELEANLRDIKFYLSEF